MRELEIKCPFCDDTSRHLYVNLVKGVYHCFKCDTSGTVVELLEEMGNGSNLASLLTESAMKAHLQPPTKAVSRCVPGQLILEEGQDPNETYFCNSVERVCAREYLRKRGVLNRQIRKYQLRVSLDSYSNIVIWFPIHGLLEGGQPLWYQGRRIAGGYTCPHQDPLVRYSCFRTFGIPVVTDRSPTIVLVEGVFDALAVERVGFNAVALLGKTPPISRLKILPLLADSFITLLDSDAQEEAIRLTLNLQYMFPNFKGVRAEGELLKKDPGEASPECLRGILFKACVALGMEVAKKEMEEEYVRGD